VSMTRYHFLPPASTGRVTHFSCQSLLKMKYRWKLPGACSASRPSNSQQMVRASRSRQSGVLPSGVYQVMSMMAPFLQGASRRHLEQLSKEYVGQ